MQSFSGYQPYISIGKYINTCIHIYDHICIYIHTFLVYYLRWSFLEKKTFTNETKFSVPSSSSLATLASCEKKKVSAMFKNLYFPDQIYTYTFVNVFIHVYIYICKCIYMYIIRNGFCPKSLFPETVVQWLYVVVAIYTQDSWIFWITLRHEISNKKLNKRVGLLGYITWVSLRLFLLGGKSIWATPKTPMTFHYTGWLIGSLSWLIIIPK